MPAFTHHVFLCGNRREPGHPRGCCDAAGKEELKAAFKKELERRGLKGQIRANGAGCLDQCEFGPCLVIYPQSIWYGKVTLADVPRIVEETIVHGRLISELHLPDECLNTKGKVQPPARGQ